MPGGSDDVWSITLDPPPRRGRDRFDKSQFGDGTHSGLIGEEVIDTVLTQTMRAFQALLNRESLLELLEDMDEHLMPDRALAHLDPQTLRAVILSDYGVSKELTVVIQQIAADAREHEISGNDPWPRTCLAAIEWVAKRTAAVVPTAGAEQ